MTARPPKVCKGFSRVRADFLEYALTYSRIKAWISRPCLIFAGSSAMNQWLKFYMALLISLAAGSASFALAYSNLQAGPRGNGEREIRGLAVRDIHYTLATDPSQISAVEFNLDGPASEVIVRLEGSEAVYFSCAHAGNNHWRCALNGVSITSATRLRVIGR